LRRTGDHAESADALLVTTTQIAIAAGAIVGGLLVDGVGCRVLSPIAGARSSQED
jgi:DHA1 family purine ribonucleoside efflux pump-like MFS transporter